MRTLARKPLAAVVAGASVLTALTVFGVARSSHAADDKAAPVKPALTVTTTKAQMTKLPIQLSANGNVAAWQEASVGSELSGQRLVEVRANVGDSVARGQVLAVFSTDVVAADLAQAQAAVQEAQANAADAAANAARARTLQTSGALSAQQISQYMTAEQTAAARIASARAALAQQLLRMKYTQVVAPDSGVISARSATIGSVVAGGTELFRMVRQGRLEWRAEVTSAEVARVKPGTSVAVKAASGSEVTGKVRTVAPTVDLQTRYALVYVDLPPMSGANAPFKAGMFASGQFQLGASDALTVPQQAVVVRDGFSYVFRLNADQRVSQLKVQTGRRLGERLEVLDGLKPDALLVVNGAGFLNDGDTVRNAGAGGAALPATAAK